MFTSVTPSKPEWIRRCKPLVRLSPGEKRMGPKQLFLIWCNWSWMTKILVKILMSLFCFLQNSSATSCHISSNGKYLVVTNKNSEKKKFLNSVLHFLLSWRWRSFKMFKGNISFYETKKLLQKHELWIKGNFILRRKKKFMLWIFWTKEKVILRISASIRRLFSTQEVGRKMIFP